MLKRTTKITALLITAASMFSLVPAMASDRLGTKDGTIENAVAFKDGKYIYQGYRSDDDDEAIYYNGGDKDKLLDDVEDGDLNGAFNDKYAFANDGGDQYLIDLTNGHVTDEDTPEDIQDTTESKLKTKLKKTDRYESNVTIDSLNKVPGEKFGDNWYVYEATPSSSAEGLNNTINGKLYGVTNDSGKYLDLSNVANIYAYSTAKGKMVKIDEFSNNIEDVDDDTDLLATLTKAPVILAQDKDYIYTLITVNITDVNANSVFTVGTTTSAAAVVQYDSNNSSDMTDIGNGKTTQRTYIQKISKNQGNPVDDAYVPKTVSSYELANGTNPKEYDCSDATDAYKSISNVIGTPADASQGDVVFQDNDNLKTKGKFTAVNGELYVIDADSDQITITSLKLKKDKIKFDSDAVLPMDGTSQYDRSDKLDVYLVEKDDDDDVDIDVDSSALQDSYDFDVDGNPWIVADGKIYKFANNEMTKMYTCDSSLDQISVYDENNLIVWEEDGDIYTTVTEGTKETESEAPPATPAKVGWDQLADGTWNLYDATGTKVVNNWANVGGTWYFLKADGIMATGWQNVNGTWYYLTSSGAMKTGWLNDNGTWYYLTSSGAMKTGWINDNGTWYFLSSSGAMQTGWINDNGTWYYLYSNGAMAANTVISGYKLSSSGALV